MPSWFFEAKHWGTLLRCQLGAKHHLKVSDSIETFVHGCSSFAFLANTGKSHWICHSGCRKCLPPFVAICDTVTELPWSTLLDSEIRTPGAKRSSSEESSLDVSSNRKKQHCANLCGNAYAALICLSLLSQIPHSFLTGMVLGRLCFKLLNLKMSTGLPLNLKEIFHTWVPSPVFKRI